MAKNDVAELLADLASLRVNCARTAVGGNSMARQMAASDLRGLDRAIESIRSDVDPSSVLAILEGLRPYDRQARAKLAELAKAWRRTWFTTESDTEYDDEDLLSLVTREGVLVTYQDWDSGGPGAGAGRVCVYLYQGAYYSTHDAGLSGPFQTEADACRSVGI